MPKISVILVTYNRMNYLRRSIQSVLSQTFSDFELLLVNNGSTDGTEALCSEYAKQDSRIKLVNILQNNGAPQGRNAGLDAASCDYITIVDDDDYCENGMLEHLWRLINEYKADISICGSWNDFGDRLEPYFIFDTLLVLDKVKGLDELLKREKFNVAPPTKLFKRTVFEGIRFPEGMLVDDIHVIYKVFANANKIVAQGVPLYRFTKHQNNMTSFIQSNNLSPKLLNEYLSMYKERTRYLSKQVPEITSRARYSQYSYMISMCDKIKIYNCEDCTEQYTFMINEIRDNLGEFWNSVFTTQREKELIQKHLNLQSIGYKEGI
ncbi:MAG: glycosyltransferase family 2 protein [Lutisporaceae bacterium]